MSRGLGPSRPLVSVIIPTWNRREQLAKAVQSVLDQEKVSVEVLVCDDGSDDDTPKMVAHWGDSRVRLIVGPRAGRPAVPRNRGIEAAEGEWLAFLDDDDVWYRDKLWKQLEAARREGCLAACSDADRVLAGGFVSGRYFGCGKLPARLEFRDILERNRVICSSAVVHRSLFSRVCGFPDGMDLRAVEDYALWLRVSAFTDFACVDEGLLAYSDVPSTSIRSASSECELTPVYSGFTCWAFKENLTSYYFYAIIRNGIYTSGGADITEIRNLRKCLPI